MKSMRYSFNVFNTKTSYRNSNNYLVNSELIIVFYYYYYYYYLTADEVQRTIYCTELVKFVLSHDFVLVTNITLITFLEIIPEYNNIDGR